MEGNSKVDELMLPVMAAIKRHVKDRDAFTDIYNRAYEAVQNGMDYLANGTYCAYCGAEFPFDDHTATLVGEHIRTCEKHPMRAVEVRAKKAEAELTALREQTRWIPVEERLPEYGKAVFILTTGSVVPKIGRHSPAIPQWTTTDLMYYHDISYSMVTHWRPIDLPEIDKESEEC